MATADSAPRDGARSAHARREAARREEGAGAREGGDGEGAWPARGRRHAGHAHAQRRRPNRRGGILLRHRRWAPPPRGASWEPRPRRARSPRSARSPRPHRAASPPDRSGAPRSRTGRPSPRPEQRQPEPPTPLAMQPASAKWYDRRDYVFVEFCVEDSKDVSVNFEKSKLTFSCLGGSDNFKHLNEIDLFNNIDPNESKHKRTDRSILCCLRKGESGQAWPRLTKERAKLNWLSVDFNNWKDWEDDSDEDMSNFDRFSEMMNNMGGDDDVDLPEVDGADDDSPDSDDEKMPDLE
ncbi:prostaglandin E synthase 3 isoform X1 [Tympanuchus pallidicinctus]|uniref:prostaglandin E synthase 3 isoform X1 n=2 Tax=Tetraoninae TaxID=466585 RepID=UPI002286D596|nr:prostaglandin E synthase 3 isoform X1 [Tympanuchus pallidicinctus]